MFKGFREFIMRGNVVDLAVAVVIGAAFGAVVKAFVDNIITPIIAAIFGQPDFSGLFFTINGSVFRYPGTRSHKCALCGSEQTGAAAGARGDVRPRARASARADKRARLW